MKPTIFIMHACEYFTNQTANPYVATKIKINTTTKKNTKIQSDKKKIMKRKC